MFLAPTLKYHATCGFDRYTIAVESVPGSLDELIYPFNLQPQPFPHCMSADTGQNETHVSISVPYEGDCGVVKGEVKFNLY